MVDRNNFVVTNHTARVAYRMRKPKPYSLRYTPGKGNNLSVYLKHYSERSITLTYPNFLIEYQLQSKRYCRPPRFDKENKFTFLLLF